MSLPDLLSNQFLSGGLVLGLAVKDASPREGP